jgi:hypothetical protein
MSWTPLKSQPDFRTSTMLLLSDGRVMVQEHASAHWHALTPDENGSYVDGTWSDLHAMKTWRQYYASGMLKDGRVIVAGGEDSGEGDQTNTGEIYDPVEDKWTSLPLPPWSMIGDAAGCILPDGRLMIGSLLYGDCLTYDPVTHAWTSAASKASRTNEETWVLQPDDTILAVQCFSPYQSEKYRINDDVWQSEGSTAVNLVDTEMHEIGPAMLLNSGKTIYFGAAKVDGVGKTAIYTPPAAPTGVGSWKAGPDIPKISGKSMVCSDCPATLMPSGKVLLTAAEFVSDGWGQPIHFFEYDSEANSIVPVSDPPNNGDVLYHARLMLLPNGEVLFGGAGNDLRVYRSKGGPSNAWRPTIKSLTPHVNNSGMSSSTDYYVLEGTQLNGRSQANMYGDDCWAATNFPLVRVKSQSTGKTHYARTYNFSTMGVSTGASVQSCRVDFSSVPYDDYDLVVVANGIPSLSQSFRWEQPRKPQYLDGVKQIWEHFGKLVNEGDPFQGRDWVVDPMEVAQLKRNVKALENTVTRLNSLIAAKDLPQVGKKIAEKASLAKKRTRE